MNTFAFSQNYTEPGDAEPLDWEAMYHPDFDVRTLSQEQCVRIGQECWANPHKFAMFFFPDLLPGKRNKKTGVWSNARMPWLHKGLLAITTKQVKWLENDPELTKIMRNFVYDRLGEIVPLFVWQNEELVLNLERYTMFMIPRGYAKTTMIGTITPLYLSLYQCLKLGLYISASATHANTQLANQKRQLEVNIRIKHFFGDLKPKMQDSAPWREDVFETTAGVTMIARGKGGQVRGLNYNGQRPQIVLVDDLEEKEQVKEEEQRKKLKDWFYADVVPCLPAMDDDAGMLVMGTLLHPESLLMTLAIDPQWSVVKFGAYDRDGELLWPENMDEKKLEKEQQSATLAGTLGVFFMERHSELRATEDADFQAGYLQYGAPGLDEELFTSLYVDPAISEQATADHATFTVTSASAKARIYVRHSEGGTGISPKAQVDKIFELYKQYQPNRVGIESNAYQKALVHLVREEMFRRKMYFEVVAVNNTIKKTMRIRGILQPRYQNKFMWHTGKFVMLEQQLLLFPFNNKDDYADGLAGSVSLLDDAAFMANDDSVSGDESPDLDVVIGGRWRHAQ